MKVDKPKPRKQRPRIYTIWRGVKERCLNPNHIVYRYYGGRGITVCEEWLIFENFRRDMGDPPFPRAEIDRIDNYKGYSKDNCRWVTRTENARNTRVNHRITANGRSVTVAEWSEILGVNTAAIHRRINRGMTEEEAVTIPFTRTAARHHYLDKTPLILQVGDFTLTPAFIKGCINRMKEGPFRARDITAVAESLGAPKDKLRRVADRVIVRMKEEENIRLLQYPIWHWIGTNQAACRLAEQANKGDGK